MPRWAPASIPRRRARRARANDVSGSIEHVSRSDLLEASGGLLQVIARTPGKSPTGKFLVLVGAMSLPVGAILILVGATVIPVGACTDSAQPGCTDKNQDCTDTAE